MSHDNRRRFVALCLLAFGVPSGLLLIVVWAVRFHEVVDNNKPELFSVGVVLLVLPSIIGWYVLCDNEITPPTSTPTVRIHEMELSTSAESTTIDHTLVLER